MRGAAEVKEHPWLKYYPWKELYEKTLEAPFIPKLGDNFDKKYCEGPDKIGDTTKERYEKYVREENFQVAFKNFTVFNNIEETINNSNNYNNNTNSNSKNQSAKKLSKDIKENSSSASSNTKTRPMHMRSSSVSVPSSALLNHNNFNSNYNNASYVKKESLNYNIHNNNNNNNNYNNINSSSHNLNSTILKSKVKIIDRDLRSSSNLGGGNAAMGINAGNTLRSSIGAYHKQTQSYNGILYGNMMQPNSNFASAKGLDKSAEKRSTALLHDSSKPFKMPPSRLPNINSIDKLKLKNLVNSSSSNLLFKYYKQSANSNNSTGASLTNQIFGKKTALAASQQFCHLNQQ